MNSLKQVSYRNALVITSAAVLTFFIVFTVSQSLYIAAAFSCFIAIFMTIARAKAVSRRAMAIQGAAPEMIDHLRAGVQSGLSLNECLIGLSDRGPEILRPYFLRFRDEIYLSGDFEKAIALSKRELAHPTTDQILESLAMAKVLGSAELLNILRLLGNFIREDLTLRREIAVKHNWIKNSAHVSAAAPWLLLLLLSTQPSTSRAFSTQSGALILLAGLAMTAAAYLWMNQLSKLPEASRVFSGSHLGRRL
jgi:tight adherence protein B